MAKTKHLDVAGALAAMRQAPGRGRGRKSEIYRWMAARYDALSAAFEKEPPSWTGLARYFAEGGMMGTDGLPPSAAAVRSAWLRVSEAMNRKRRRPSAPQTTAEPEVPAQPHDDDPAGDEPIPSDFPTTFTPVRRKD